MPPSAIAAAYHARSQSKTPLTDKETKLFATQDNLPYRDWVPVTHSHHLELLLWEARSLLSRIADGAEPVLMEQEIEDFLTKTELS